MSYDLDPVLAALVDEQKVDLMRLVSGARKVELARAAAGRLGRLVTSHQVDAALNRIRKARGVAFCWGGQANCR